MCIRDSMSEVTFPRVLGRADKGVSLTSVAPRKGKDIQEKKKILPQQVIFFLETAEMASLSPLTDFMAVVGEIGQWQQCPAEHLVPNHGRGQRHLTNTAGTTGPRTGPKPSSTPSKS